MYPDNVWDDIRHAAAELADNETLLRKALLDTVLSRRTLEECVSAILADKLQGSHFAAGDLQALFTQILSLEPGMRTAIGNDIRAVLSGDPACPNALHVVMNLKGFLALQAHRIAHCLWQGQRQALAFALASQASLVFGVDIHPAAILGSGIMIDHATGVVIGETAVVDDDVCIMQNVTLGGTGKERGDRHPKVHRGVMLGAGCKVLGNIDIGMMSKIAAGSVVLASVPPFATVAGVPARIVRRKRHGDRVPYAINHSI